MSRRLAVGALLAALLVSCNPGAREAEPFEGSWQSEAWGMYLSISGGSVEIFEYSSAQCFSVASGGTRGIAEVLAFEGEELLLIDGGRTVRFDRFEFLPEECLAEINDDPVSTFEALVATIEERYVRGVDAGWSTRVEASRPDADADDEALLGAMIELLAPLHRPDVRLAGGGETWVANPPDQVIFPEAEAFGEGGLLGGSVGDGVSYLAFLRLSAFADDLEESQRLAAEAVDLALAGGEGLILDLRGSDGGSIDHAMLIASRFVPTARVVAHLSARSPAGLAAAGEVTVRPLPTGIFAGRVAVLVGPGTIGVGELLVEAIAGVDGVTVIGQPTAGSPGPGMVRFLPNGWSVGFPNLEATSGDGTAVLGGITPDLISADPLSAALQMLGG
jgi:hypothetical protein